MIGTTFANFSVVERVNRGGMADIYLVRDAHHNPYALRLLLPEFRYNWRRVRQFRWGCKVLASLDHPNIVHCYGESKFRSQRYAVLEYVDGPNLKEKILRNDPLLPVHQRQLLIGMAAALAHVHERGYLQLDFKPENVLIPKTYQPKLVDFDLAVVRPDTPRRMSSVAGTVAYLAPEQIAGEPVDERADIFAFGITAYETVTGKKPVAANTREELLAKYTSFNEHLVPLRSRAPDLPPAIERVILKCLELDVSRRYPSISLVVRDLQA